MRTWDLEVEGMTCKHCEQSLTDEFNQIGTDVVGIELRPGEASTVTLRSERVPRHEEIDRILGHLGFTEAST